MPSNDTVAWPSAAVAVAVLLMVGTIGVAAIVEYDSVDDAQEIFNGLNVLVGTLLGSFVGYFFTRGQVTAAENAAAKDREERLAAEQQAREAFAALDPTVARLLARRRSGQDLL